jgi:hypothetical protein
LKLQKLFKEVLLSSSLQFSVLQGRLYLFDTGSHYVAQVGFELKLLLPHIPSVGLFFEDE